MLTLYLSISFLIILIIYILICIFYRSKQYFDKRGIVSSPNKIIVSLTTIPSRVNNLPLVVDSILNNTIVPDIIYINIPRISSKENKEYEIPEELKLNNKVKINITEKDFGPLTKLYPTLLEELDPESVIICVDDDKEYDDHLIEHLLLASEKYPHSCICISGWNYINLGILALPITIPINNMVKNVDILQCYNGVLYKRKFFKDDFDEYINIEECKTTDDISISKYLNNNEIEILSIPYNFKHKDIDNSNSISLGNINLKNNNWIKCINKEVEVS
jgi:hypothetical protein